MGGFGTLGNHWDAWHPSTSKACRNCPHCGVLHVPGVADLEVYGECGECPAHKRCRISIHRLRLGDAAGEGDNFIEQEMDCGNYPVGVSKLWVNLKVPCILSFTMKVHCYTCRQE